MQQYQKIPVIIEAVIYTYPASKELRDWLGEFIGDERKVRNPGAKGELEIFGLEDGHDKRWVHVATEGDYIIKGVEGEFYACKPDIFKKTYRAI